MTREQKIAVLQRWTNALNQKDMGVLDRLADEIFTPDFVEHDPDFPDFEPGPGGVKKFVRQIITANPDLHGIIDDILVDGDKAMSRGTVQVNDVDTGKPVSLLLLAIDRFVGDQIAEEWELGVPGKW